MTDQSNQPRQALVVIHEAADTLDPLVYGLVKFGFNVQYWNPLFQESPPIDVARLDLIIQLGGTANVGNPKHAEWMLREMRYVEAGLKRNIPVFSICLGAQMLADLLGARIYKLNQPEIGVFTLNVDEPIGVLAAIHTASGRVFQSHSYAFDLPGNAKRLAHSDPVPCQAFEVGHTVLATQFHPDATFEVFSSWLLETPSEIDDAIRTKAKLHCAEIQKASAQMFIDWLGQALE